MQMIKIEKIIKCGKVYIKNRLYNLEINVEHNSEIKTENLHYVLFKAFNYAEDVNKIVNYLAV